MTDTVRISPLPAHFLQRSNVEQAIVAGCALGFAGVLGLPTYLWSLDPDYPAGLIWLFTLASGALGVLGWKVGTWAANIHYLLRLRRARNEGRQG